MKVTYLIISILCQGIFLIATLPSKAGIRKSYGLTAPIKIITLFVIFSDNANKGGVNVVVGRIKK